MTREGRASSTRSKNSSSIHSALREKTEKLAPPLTSVAPIGKLRPIVGAAKRFFLYPFSGTGHGCTFHISPAYSAMVRSLENFPELAMFQIALAAHFSGLGV